MPKVKEVATLWPPLRGVAATGVSTQSHTEEKRTKYTTVR